MHLKDKDNHLDTDPIEGLGKPDCPHCGGLGYIIPEVPPVDPRFGRAVTCTCRAVEREMARINQLMQLSQLGTLQNCTFDTFLPDGLKMSPSKQRNLRRAFDDALAYAQDPKGWLVFKGGYGSGKTHLAAAIANQRIAMGYPALFVNTPDLLDHLRATFSPNSPIGYDQRFEQIRNTPLLILDDLGAQSNSDWAQEKLYQIFNHRYNNRLPTVVTTNLELEAIEMRIRSRLVDLSLVHIIHIAAPDFRRGGIDQDHSDLSSLSLHSNQTFETFDLRENELKRNESGSLKTAYDAAFEFAKEPNGWIIFYSIYFGNGKTHLASAIANYVSRNGEPVLFVMVPDLLDHLRATFNPLSNTRYDKRFDEVKTSSLLILDDLGTESATGWAKEKLYQLFNYRYNAQLPTVITTAVHFDQWDERLKSRMLDKNLCRRIQLRVPGYSDSGHNKKR